MLNLVPPEATDGRWGTQVECQTLPRTD